jgi:DNA repair protein RadA/Sms
VPDAPLFLLAETSVERLVEEVGRVKPALLVVDSIQTVYSVKLNSAPGTVSQVRQAATDLLFLAKGRNLPTILAGHVTKDGSLAGPKVLEHVVDTVLYFEGEQHHTHRIVRAVKNRYGAASELGVFEMTGAGLRAVPNPSALFLAERPAGAPGSVVLCTIEGSRPILVEIQALVGASTFGNARRTASGIDQNRLALLLAVLDRRAGLSLATDDVYVNVAGGMRVDEPAADLAIVAAVASSLRNRPLPADVVVFGEVGLAGEVRAASQAVARLREAAQLGFARCVMPDGNVAPADVPAGLDVVGVRTIGDALDVLL